MATEKDYQSLQDRIAALRETVTNRLAPDLIANPQLAETVIKQIDDMLATAVAADAAMPAPPDKGLSQLAGIGPDATSEFGKTRIPQGVAPYDDTITSERIVAVGDLYYIFQHETIGVFRVVRKLQELFRAGAVRLSGGQGAFALYQFDRREVLRYTARERINAYRRVLGYGQGQTPGSRPNVDFHHMFAHFAQQVTLFWRDKRISDVVRERAYDPSFGSMAIVRRAGLDLRNNLKWTSFGHLNVLRVEVMQLLEEAFKILDADDVKRLFGADNAWDVVEEVLIRYFNERLVTSPRQRMAVAGREVLRWLAQPHILTNTRAPFETLLLEIAEMAEEWITSAQAMGLAERTGDTRVLPWDRPNPTPGRGEGDFRGLVNSGPARGSAGARGAVGAARSGVRVAASRMPRGKHTNGANGVRNGARL
jgi:hypothetical protein